MSTDGQGTEWHRNITENGLSRTHERYTDRQTDVRQTDLRRHIAITFAKKCRVI